MPTELLPFVRDRPRRPSQPVGADGSGRRRPLAADAGPHDWKFGLAEINFLVLGVAPMERFLHIASSGTPEAYPDCWQVETLFGALKSRAFNLEDTHLTEPRRLTKPLVLLAHVRGML